MSILHRLFGRPIAEDWCVGDLAECVARGPWYRFGTGEASTNGPKSGERYVVRSVGIGDSGRVMLGFVRFGKRRYDAHGFRKVTPRADAAIAADAAFVDRLRRRELVR
jgi:hypothetical protein